MINIKKNGNFQSNGMTCLANELDQVAERLTGVRKKTTQKRYRLRAISWCRCRGTANRAHITYDRITLLIKFRMHNRNVRYATGKVAKRARFGRCESRATRSVKRTTVLLHVSLRQRIVMAGEACRRDRRIYQGCGRGGSGDPSCSAKREARAVSSPCCLRDIGRRGERRSTGGAGSHRPV